jgi:hypothetical protein
MSEKGSSSVELIFREHTAATIDRKDTEVAISSLAPDKFKAEKVTVDLLGRIHPCND